MIKALIDALADTLGWVKARRLSETLADVKDEEQFQALADMVEEIEAETLDETLSDMKPKHWSRRRMTHWQKMDKL